MLGHDLNTPEALLCPGDLAFRVWFFGKEVAVSDVVLGQVTLKIKFASLADEAKYIARLERKIKRHRAKALTDEQRAEHSRLLSSIQGHRREDIRREARATHLARMMLRGTGYTRVESKCWTQPNWERVVTLISSHVREDVRVVRQRVAEWGDVASLKKAA